MATPEQTMPNTMPGSMPAPTMPNTTAQRFQDGPLRHILTLDIGGSAVKYGLCNTLGELTAKGQKPTPNDATTTVQDMVEIIASIHDEVKRQGLDFEGIAISLPGCVFPGGFMYTGGALPYMYGQPFADLVEKRIGLRPTLENDAKAAAAAELWMGSLKGIQVGTVLILGTGLGGGIVIDGKVFQGPNGAAGELSNLVHLCDNFSGVRSCEAQNVSATGLVLRACDALGLEYRFTEDIHDRMIPIDGKKVFELYHEGNEAIHQVITDFGFETGKLIFNLCTVLNLQKVAIGGGISSQDCLIESIKAGTDRAWAECPVRMYKPLVVFKPEIAVCEFHNDANLIGAMYQYLCAHPQAPQT